MKSRNDLDSELDSELVWWPWGKASDGPRRLGRPWRAIFLVAAQALLIWVVLSLGPRLDQKLDQKSKTPATELTAQEATLQLRARGLLVPVVGVERWELRSSFSDPRGSRSHLGIDIQAPRHRPIVAAEAGRIVKLAAGKLSGLAVHQISADGRFVYFYAHLETYADGLEAGDRVRAGDLIGHVGTSGNAQTPHLHFGIRQLDRPGQPGSGRALDPFAVLSPRL